MAGFGRVLGRVALGAVAGYAGGVVEENKARAAAALEALKQDREDAQRQQDHDWRMEEIGYRDSLKGKSGGRSGGGSGGAASAPKRMLTVEEAKERGLDPKQNWELTAKTGGVVSKGERYTGPTDEEIDTEVNEALTAANITNLPMNLRAQIVQRVRGGEEAAKVVDELEVPEEVNPAGTGFSRWIGWTPEDAAPDSVRQGTPTGFRTQGRGDTPPENAAPVSEAAPPSSKTQDPPEASTDAPEQRSAAPQAAIDFLKANPTAEMRAAFDQKYGAGSAERVLGS